MGRDAVLRTRWPFIKSSHSEFPLMSLIGANAFLLFAGIKAKIDGNLTFPAFCATSESALSAAEQSPASTSCRIRLSEDKGS